MFAYSFYCALCSITAHNISVLVTPLTVVKTCIILLCTSLRQSKVSLKLIYYVLLLNTMHSRKNMQTCFKLDGNGTKQNKKYTTNLAFTALENGC